jgi:hypothetical protein
MFPEPELASVKVPLNALTKVALGVTEIIVLPPTMSSHAVVAVSVRVEPDEIPTAPVASTKAEAPLRVVTKFEVK